MATTVLEETRGQQACHERLIMFSPPPPPGSTAAVRTNVFCTVQLGMRTLSV